MRRHCCKGAADLTAGDYLTCFTIDKRISYGYVWYGMTCRVSLYARDRHHLIRPLFFWRIGGSLVIRVVSVIITLYTTVATSFFN
jgi:hypothetical protein